MLRSNSLLKESYYTKFGRGAYFPVPSPIPDTPFQSQPWMGLKRLKPALKLSDTSVSSLNWKTNFFIFLIVETQQ